MSKNLNVGVVITALILTLGLSGCIEQADNISNPIGGSDKTSTSSAQNNSMEELKIEDLKVGTGAEAVSGKSITVHYTGTLTDGTKFDSSVDRGTPFTFNLGAGEVIEGWDKGFAGMKVGGKRKLTIPSQMGYGERGAPPTIPANATLIFEVELLKVE